MTETNSDVEPPDELDYSNLDQYSDAEIEAWNDQRRDEIEDTIESFNERQEAAVNALREDAQKSADTETVELSSGIELEVRTRIPPAVEQLVDDVRAAQQEQDLDRARRLGAAANAEMVESPAEYTSAEVWVVASQDGAAGVQWLTETTQTILGPARDRAETKGNENSQTDSDATPAQTTGKDSGWQRQR